MNNKQTSKRIAASLLALCVLAAVPAVGGAQIVYSGYNAVPVWGKTGNPTVIQGQTFSTTIVATDDNGDPLTYSSIQLPAGATFNPVTRAFSFTPSFTHLVRQG
jgi:hypothetical protein